MFPCLGQGVFESNTSSGNWNSAGSWSLTSGSDADGIPDSDDDVTINAGHTIQIAAAGACNDLTFAGGTMAFNSTVTITVNNDVQVSADGSSITGHSNDQILSINGDMTIPSGFDFSITAFRFTVTGSLSISGSLSLTGWGQTRSFGNTTINSGGSLSLSGADDYTFTGNLTNEGTFTANAHDQSFTFTGTAGVISGSGLISIFEGLIDSPAAYTNQGNLQIRSSLSGTGSFTNGNGGMLELQNGGPFSVTTFSASGTGNTISYTGHGSPIAFSGDYYNLVLNKSSGNLSFDTNLSILNDLTISGGIFQIDDVTISVGNDLVIGGGELTPDNASAVLNVTGGLTMTSGEYDQNNGDVNITGDISVTGGAFTLDGAGSTLDAASASFAGATVTLNDGEFNLTGDFTTNTGVTLNGRGTNLTIPGTFKLTDGDIEFASGDFKPANLEIASGKTLSITASVLTSTGNTIVNGSLSFSGSAGPMAFGNIQVNSGGSWSVSQEIDFTVSGNITNDGTITADPGYGSGLVSMSSTNGSISGSGSTTIRNIQIQSPAQYTNTGNLVVSSSLTGTGSFINGENASLSYQGDNSGGSNFDITNFTASATGNTVTYGRAGDQQLRTTTDTDNNYYNLVVSSTAAGHDVTLAGDITIDNQLTLTMGDVVLGTNRLSLADGVTVSGGSVDSYIAINNTGVLRQNYSTAGATLAFPIGDIDDFSPITAFTINSATFGTGAYLEFDITDADHPNRDSSNTPTGDDDGTTAVAYISRYWTVTANAITSPDYNADYVYIETDVTGTESDMVGALYRTHPAIGILDWSDVGTVNTTTKTVSLTNADAFGDMYAMDNTLQRLPIVLVSFEALYGDGQVKLNWVTASEENNSYFTIERSLNGRDFEEVLLRTGAGHSQTLIHYEATDINPPVGRVFYRLKQTDFNGTFAYSELVGVDVIDTRRSLGLEVFGNPVERGEDVKLSRNQAGPGQLTLRSVDGKTNRTYQLSEDNGLMFEIGLNGDVAPGLYLLQLIQHGEKVSKKLIVR